MKNKIGIILPVYSANKNFNKVVKSISDQILKPNEVIVVTHKKFDLKKSR